MFIALATMQPLSRFDTVNHMALERHQRTDGRECESLNHCPLLDDKYIEAMAEKAAERAIQKMTALVYQEVGRRVVSKLFYIVGVSAVAVYFWLKTKGIIQ